MRFFLLTIVTLGLYPVVRVALGLCRLFGVGTGREGRMMDSMDNLHDAVQSLVRRFKVAIRSLAAVRSTSQARMASASRQGHPEAGADPNAKHKYGRTPLS